MKEEQIRKLKSIMVLHGDNQMKLAQHLNLSVQSLSYKMTGKIQFTLEEVNKIMSKYKMQPDQVVEIFIAK